MASSKAEVEIDDQEAPAHNLEADENTAELEQLMQTEAIGSTMYNKSWVLRTVLAVREKPETAMEELESLSDMSRDPEVAKFMASEAGAHTMLLTMLLDKPSFRCQEFALVILANLLREDFENLRHDPNLVLIPTKLVIDASEADDDNGKANNKGHEFTMLLVAFCQFLSVYMDMSSDDEPSTTCVNLIRDEKVAQKLCILVASTTNPDLLAKASRLILNIVDLGSAIEVEEGNEDEEEQQNEQLISAYLSPSALLCLHEGLKQSLDFQDCKTSYVIIETMATLCDTATDELPMENEQIVAIFEAVQKFMHENNEQDLDLRSVSACSRLCKKLWTKQYHEGTFDTISKFVLDNDNDNKTKDNDDEAQHAAIKSILQCLKHCLGVHSETLLANQDDQLKSETLGQIVKLLVSVDQNG